MGEAAQLVMAAIAAKEEVIAITTLRGIYGAYPRDAEIATMSFPAIAYQEMGGSARYNGRLQNIEFYIYAFSRISGGQARDLYDLAFQALQAQRLILPNVQQVGLSRELRRGESGFEERFQAWSTRGYWTATLAG
jgi:hypothetical protein